MYVIFLAVSIGAIIGVFTNALAIKMLFRPFKPWMIGKIKLPFTPGLIPKRREEIAWQLGILVEQFLFTPQGMKDFIEKSGLQEIIFLNLTSKLNGYRHDERKIGDVLASLFNEEWNKGLQRYVLSKLNKALASNRIRKMTLEQLIPLDTQARLEKKLISLSPYILEQTGKYFHTIEGKRLIEASFKQIFENKKMFGLLTVFLLDNNQLYSKLLEYIDQVLASQLTRKKLNDLIIQEWEKLKKEPLETYIIKHRSNINIEALSLLNMGVVYLSDIPISQVVDKLEKNQDTIKGIYDYLLKQITGRIDQLFAYLSISQVVKKEVSSFSLLKLESLILEITGKELRMITIFGGVLGGLIGLLQGILFIFL